MSLRGALDCICTAVQGLEPFDGSVYKINAHAHHRGGAYQDYHAWCEVEAINLRPTIDSFDSFDMAFDAMGSVDGPASLYHVQVALLVPLSLKSPGAGAGGASALYRTFYTMMDPSPSVLLPSSGNRHMALAPDDPDDPDDPDLRTYRTSAIRELERLSSGQLYHDSEFGIDEAVNTDTAGHQPIRHLHEVNVQGVYRLQDDDVRDAAFGVLRFQIETSVKGGLSPLSGEYL